MITPREDWHPQKQLKDHEFDSLVSVEVRDWRRRSDGSMGKNSSLCVCFQKFRGRDEVKVALASRLYKPFT
jgi:hypothetical protein